MFPLSGSALCAQTLQIGKSLRSLVQRSLLFMAVLRLFPAPLVIPSCAGDDPTAHSITSVLRHFLSRCGHRTCPAPRASSEPTAHIIIPVFRHFLAQCGHRACPAPVPVMSLLHSTSKLMIMAWGLIRSCYEPMTYQHAPRHRVYLDAWWRKIILE